MTPDVELWTMQDTSADKKNPSLLKKQDWSIFCGRTLVRVSPSKLSKAHVPMSARSFDPIYGMEAELHPEALPLSRDNSENSVLSNPDRPCRSDTE